MTKFTKITFKLLDVLIIFALTFGSPMSALAQVWTDPTDYPPGSVVTIRGDNSDEDNDHNFLAGEAVHVDVVGPTENYTLACDAVADENGTWACDVTLSADPAVAVGLYNFTAMGLTSGNEETGTFTDAPPVQQGNPSADLDQCANDPLPSPHIDGCNASANPSPWVNGNLGASKSVYFEGDSIPYRMRFANLNTAISHTVIIAWDTTKDSKHAIDYLTTFNRTVANANPCLDVSGCGSPTTFSIPSDPQVTGGGVTPIAGNFTMYNGTITSVSAYSDGSGSDGFPTGTNSRRISITFTTTVANPVLAWGGHISTRADWGANNSAVTISGSPYHTALVDLDGSGGSQDRSLSAEAVIFPASITIIKDADPNDAQDFGFTATGGLASPFTLDDDADGTYSNTQSYSDILVTNQNGNNYTVVETTVAGWTLSFGNPVCTVTSANGGSQSGNTGTGTVSINLREGENVTCTFINTRQPAHLKLVKTLTNNNGGTAVVTDFTLSASGPTPISGAGGAESNVDPGTYSLSETGPSGYAAGSWSCVGGTQNGSNVTLGAGQSATCTINNDDQGAHLKLVKTVTNDNGGTALVTDFTLSAAGPTPISGAGGAESDVNTGTYNLSETTVDGYTAGAWSCVGGIQNGASVTLALGESATCMINNNDNAAHLKLVKTVTNDNGGTAATTDFTLSAAGPTPISGAGGAESDVNAGSYNLSETNLPGYTASSWSCVGGTQNGGSVSLALGESATCTINNNDQAAHLKLVKTVTNDNGGTAVTTDFTLSASGPTPISGAGGAESDVNAGNYNLSETNLPGYTASAWSCVGGTQNGASVSLALGESATCTINNNDQTAHLKLVKDVTNDNGGTAVATDFTLSASGPTPISGAGGAESDVNTGTYNLSETTVGGYTAGSWSCVGGTQNGASVSLALGQSAICTINNNDQTAHLKLVKTVTNDNGGTAVATDFTLSAAGPTPISGAGGAESDVNTGTYNLSETNVPGYTASSWTCVGGTQNGASVSLALGESATCTINNNDNAPSLTLVKVVVNNNGGTAVESDWTLTATGPTGFSGNGPSVSNGASFDAGSYDLSESGPDEYSASAWVCVGGTQNDGDTIIVGLGESATCTITNNDNAPALHLRKIVVNDNGGTAVATDWTLSAAGPTPLSGTTPVDSGASFDQGTYALSESGPANYSASAWVCVGGTQNGSNITVGLGESATCTITNNDNAPALHLRKIVVNDNGGTAAATDWTLNADGSGANDLSGSTPVDSGAGLQADTFALSESGPAGYSASAWSCVGGTQNGSNITVGIGQSATCTITNNDIPPQLHLRKIVVNDNGGTATVADFTLTANGTGSNDLSGTSPVDSGAGLQADTWALSETSPAGYSASAWVCVGGTQNGSNITVGLGESATCTITNNDNAPKLHLRKVVVNDNGGTKTVADFILTANGAGTNDLSGTSPVDSGAGLKADTWALSETSVYGYSASAWVCVGGTQNGSNITVGIGGEATCTITNDDQPGTIIIKKITKPVNTGSFTFTTTGAGYNGFTIPGGGQNSQTLNAGDYTVTEGTQLGWILTGIGQDPADPNNPMACAVTGQGGSTGTGNLNTMSASITLKNGDTVTCVFENTGQGVTRTQGFWATHTPLANIAWFGGTAFGHTFPGVAGTAGIGDTTICSKNIDTLEKLMGGFWSDVSKKSNNAKRSALDQARMQLLQQLLAAELNASAFGSVPAGGSGQFAVWEAALCGNNQTAIQNAMQGAASFNNSGDSAIFTPGTSADSRYARQIANKAFWDNLP